MEVATSDYNTRFNDLNKLGHNKPKLHQTLSLHSIAKNYKIKYSKLNKENLIKKIIEYENNNNVITDLNDTQQDNSTHVLPNSNYNQRKLQLERLNFTNPAIGHTTCVIMIARLYNFTGLSYLNKSQVINRILHHELNNNIITNVIPTENPNPQYLYDNTMIYKVRLPGNREYNPRRFYFPEHIVYEYRYIDFVKHLHNINTLGYDTNYLYHISQLRENEIAWINQYAANCRYNVNIDQNWVNENDDFSTQHFINEKYKVKEKNALLLENIKDIVWDNQSECSSCTICMCEFEEKEIIKGLKCGHNFHSECLKQWIMREPNCPCCRVNIN